MFLKDKVTFDKLEKILSEEKSNQHEQISFNKNNIESVLPTELLKRDKRYIEEYIIDAIKKSKKDAIIYLGDESMEIIDYEEKYLDDFKDLLVEL
ncbi:MAG: hypothetical protein PHN42_05200 [Bacilli bacterium]|nr:hypothetical protein [Bacilli bacterium]